MPAIVCYGEEVVMPYRYNTIDIIVGHVKYLRDKMQVNSEARRQTMK
jgi:hypothetical protein